MSQDYLRRQLSMTERPSSVPSVIPDSHEDSDDDHRGSYSPNVQRHLSTVSQIYLPRGHEYYPQERVPPTGPEAQQPFILKIVEDDQHPGEQRRSSIITPVYRKKGKKLNKKLGRIFFFIEPIIGGLILFPIIALFWESGWNLIDIILNRLNKLSSNFNAEETIQDDTPSYTWQSLIYPYLIVQFLLLLYYLCQNFIYNFLKNQKWLIKILLLKFHILVLATIYIIQWEMLWTIWDEYIPHQWYFELTLSLTALFGFIVFNGHLADLICSPFLLSYDSIEYCIHFGCPLLTKKMKQWKINLINYVLYEIFLSNLSIMSWRGFYNFIDNYFFPKNLNMSAGISLLIGYILYFPLMYFQKYLEELHMKYEFWTFISINFPQFYRNIRHLLAFLSCVFLWRGYGIFYDAYFYIFKDYYKTYLLFYIGSFLVLSILQTASSINGPLSNINEKNNFFPLYPHCYVSIVQRKFSRSFCSKPKPPQDNYEP